MLRLRIDADTPEWSPVALARGCRKSQASSAAYLVLVQEQPIRRLRVTGEVEHLIKIGTDLQRFATAAGIHNVMTDNGYQELILLTMFGLRKLRREGNDAVDDEGREYELKTVGRTSSDGRRKSSLSVTTEHTMTLANIERYRAAHLWIIAIFDQSLPEVIYEITPAALEPYFSAWATRLDERDGDWRLVRDHLNNPKIPIWFVERHGVRVWPPETANLGADSQR